MSKFEPNTTVYFCRTGIDDSNKPYFDSGQGSENPIVTWIIESGAKVATALNYSFQRTDGRLRIAVGADEVDYDTLLNCDTIVYKNLGVSNDAMWIVGNITSVEWINPNNSYVFYQVDYYCTYAYLIDWNSSICYVEREHVKEDWVNNGGECPAFSNMGPPEDFNYQPDTPLYYSNMNLLYSGVKPEIVIYTPYGAGGEEADFEGEMTDSGVYSGLTAYVVNNAGSANSYLNKVAQSDKADVDRIPLIQTLPKIAISTTPISPAIDIPMPWLYEEKTISGDGTFFDVTYIKNVNHIKYRNAKCWSSQFCKMRLQSFEGDTIDYNPQWFGSGIAETKWHVSGARAEGGLMIMSGLAPKNITFLKQGLQDFWVAIRNPPTAPWVGDLYAQWAAVNGPIMALRGMNSVASGGMKIAQDIFMGDALGVLADASDMTNDMINIAQSFREAKASGSSVNGGFAEGPNQAAAMSMYGFQLTTFIVQPYIMDAIDEFFDVYGYRVNRVKVPERNTRTYWNYIKTHNAHISGAKLSFVARTAIERLLNRGVTFWNGTNVNPEGSGGVTMGDYSKENREANRSVGG